jgi:hypothetical protein
MSLSWTWAIFLASIACLAFGSACSFLSLIGEAPSYNWCPASSGNATALLFLGVAGGLPSLLAMNDDGKRLRLHRFFVHFRFVTLGLFWLKARGPSWVLFGYLGMQAGAEIVVSTTRLSESLPKSRPLYIASVLTLACLCLISAYRNQSFAFLLSWFMLNVVEANTYSENEHDSVSSLLEAIAPLFSVMIVFSASSPEVALACLVSAEAGFAALSNDSLERDLSKLFVTRGTSPISMPLHRAAVVAGSLALCSTALLALNPLIIADYILSQMPRDSGRLWLLFAVVYVAQKVGPRMADSVHKQTTSLLKTGLIGFWLCVLAIVPALTAYALRGFRETSSAAVWGSTTAEELILLSACALWYCCYWGLVSVEHKIISEWSVATDAVAEQRALTSLAVATAAAANVMIASALPDSMAVSVCTIFALLCSLIAAMAYTIWFVQNDRGAWRLVDEEGRELLHVTG